MNGELFRLAVQGLRRKKRSSLILFLVLCFSFAFAIITLSVNGQYGRHQRGVPAGQLRSVGRGHPQRDRGG